MALETLKDIVKDYYSCEDQQAALQPKKFQQLHFLCLNVKTSLNLSPISSKLIYSNPAEQSFNVVTRIMQYCNLQVIIHYCIILGIHPSVYAVSEDYFTNMKEYDQTELSFDSKSKLGFKNRKCTYIFDRFK